jgi:vacuolar-type H+-ATPase subunit I/STV1
MNKTAYWIIWLMLLVFALVGLVGLISVPQLSNTSAADFQQYFLSQYVTAAVIGLVAGSFFGWRATKNVYHEPKERGTDFTRRVSSRGLTRGLVAAIIAGALSLTYASINSVQPLAPLEMVIAVVSNGLFWVVMAIAMLCSMLTYSIATRMPAWGGQYALIKRF